MKQAEGEAKASPAPENAPQAQAAPAPEAAQAQAAQEQAAPAPAEAPPPDPAAQLQAELEKTRGVVAEQYDKYLRLQAEFENFKKRMQREQAEQLKFAQLPLLRELTAVMDNLESALQHGRGGQADLAAVVSGVDLVAKQMGETFERFGMARLKSASQPFDPARHQAVSVVETNDVPENQVIEEFRPGYVLHDRVVRPAMVSVSKKASGNGVADDAPAP